MSRPSRRSPKADFHCASVLTTATAEYIAALIAQHRLPAIADSRLDLSPNRKVVHPCGSRDYVEARSNVDAQQRANLLGR